MKFLVAAAIATLASLSSATPTPTIEKRANPDEACNIGYASSNGGTTGGSGGTTTTVSSLPSFSAAVAGDAKKVVYVQGSISGTASIRVGANTSILGKSGASITGVNLHIRRVNNVIVRNLKLSKVKGNDCITVNQGVNVWLDHLDLSGDLNVGKDYYDGLIDITHAADWVTVSHSYFHDHWKGSLVGHSDNNAGEDTGKLHVTYANCRFVNVNSRTPSIRFGTGHIYNNYYQNIPTSGINTRMGAKVLVESSTFVNANRAITSIDSDIDGSAAVNDVNLGGSTNDAPSTSAFSLPYSYSLVGSGNAQSATSSSGATISF
ncbi:polysaccharide lyase family 1 protein [Parathielavia hyrcaniae]|uniref:Polysaccharide lyase family 1 protein n=1 Tax=Parathielavia hyrcaniae TaxID=113614 RepID=A0AAN6Q5Z8_9PEZI|nr:polysaccharide lyase family 1 protein [Parathielavia hyrcaniae]